MIAAVVLDLDGVLQNPVYPHPKLIADVSAAIGVPFDELYDHYAREFTTNPAEEKYHLSRCGGDPGKEEKVDEFWRKMDENMPKANIIPGARELLEEIALRGCRIFAWTKVADEKGLYIQRSRLQRNGLLEFFGDIIYSHRKGTDVGLVEDLVPRLPKGRKLMVGDSYLQDIEPALRQGDFTCVWIRWDQETPEDFDPTNPNLTVVESTQELVQKVKEGVLDVQSDH
ncbi:MAG TPA: HAD hydrolase-like protein [Candidatus Nanoarchaeia archaeon]